MLTAVPPAPARPESPASTESGPSGQLLLVRVPHTESTRGTLQMMELADGRWHPHGPAVSARIGRGGLHPATTRRQGSGTTPSGTFGLTQAFGTPAAPQVRLPYLRIRESSTWPYDPTDPATYNVLQPRSAKPTWRPQWSERLAAYPRRYRHAVVIDYNLPQRVRYRPSSGQWQASRPARLTGGGGIFLHVSIGRPTSGCVAVPAPVMRKVLRWLDPARQPQITITSTATPPPVG